MKRRLKLARREAGLTQLEVAKAVGVSRGAVANWETPNSPSSPSLSHLTALADLYGKSVDEMTSRFIQKVNGQNGEFSIEIPLLSVTLLNSKKSSGGNILHDILHELSEESVPCPIRLSGRAWAITVEGQSMVAPHGAKTYPPQSIVYFEPVGDQSNVKSGTQVIARLDSGAYIFRQYIDEDGARWLRALNPEYDKITEQFEIVAEAKCSLHPE